MGLYAKFEPGDRFAILSSVFHKVHVHFIKDASGSKFVRCLAPDRCLCCEKKFKDWYRFGAYIYDYQEKGQFKIKAWTHQAEYLNKFFYSILKNYDLRSMDFIYNKKKGDKNSFTVIDCVKDKLPEWYRNSPDEVKKAWEDYEEDDILSLLCRDLNYQGQVEFIKEVNSAGSSDSHSAVKVSEVGDFLSGKVTDQKKPTPKNGAVKSSTPHQERVPVNKGKSSSPSSLEEPKEFATAFNGVPDDLM